MRIFLFIQTVVALVAVAACTSLPVRQDCGPSEIRCRPDQLMGKRSFLELPARTVRGLTNAELLRRGLPLNYPILRRGTLKCW